MEITDDFDPTTKDVSLLNAIIHKSKTQLQNKITELSETNQIPNFKQPLVHMFTNIQPEDILLDEIPESALKNEDKSE